MQANTKDTLIARNKSSKLGPILVCNTVAIAMLAVFLIVTNVKPKCTPYRVDESTACYHAQALVQTLDSYKAVADNADQALDAISTACRVAGGQNCTLVRNVHASIFLPNHIQDACTKTWTQSKLTAGRRMDDSCGMSEGMECVVGGAATVAACADPATAVIACWSVAADSASKCIKCLK